MNPRPEGSTRLVLARHGETVWHAENRYAGGSSDIDLTDRGRDQARTLARWAGARTFDALAVSPVRRAMETAAPVAARLNLPLDVHEDLREIDFGVAEGRTLDEMSQVDAEMVHEFRADPVAHPFPDAESFVTAARRAADCLRLISARHRGGRVLVVAHNTLMRLALCDLLDLPVARYRQLFPALVTGAITEISVPSDPSQPAALLMLNALPLDPADVTPTAEATAPSSTDPRLHSHQETEGIS